MYAVYSYLLDRSVQHAALIARPWRAFLGLMMFLVFFSPPALAYLDPGTGSILLQGLIAAVAAAVTYAGLYWRKIKAFFLRLIGRVPPKPCKPDRTSGDGES